MLYCLVGIFFGSVLLVVSFGLGLLRYVFVWIVFLLLVELLLILINEEDIEIDMIEKNIDNVLDDSEFEFVSVFV